MPFYQTVYEWTCEIVRNHPNPDYRDILEVNFGDTLEEVQSWGKMSEGEIDNTFLRYALVKSVGNDDEGLVYRTWADLDECGKLPKEFENGDKVPKRFDFV
jgi:hypothetical protein